MTPKPSETEEVQVGFTDADISDIRKRADDDVFYFGKVICGHKDLVFVDHAPLMYAAAGDAENLLAVLRSDLDSYTIRQFRKEAKRHGVDIWAEDAQGRLAEKLRVVDLRVYRGSGKSSALTHAVRLWKMVRWPNMSSALITNTDDKAKDFCRQIRATILTSLFAIVYPDRIPVDQKSMLTENRLTVAGRDVPDKEPCLMVFGHKASPTGYHFDEIDFDDLIARENKSVTEIAMGRDFLSNVIDLQNPGIRFPVRRVHKGTRWDEMDDAEYVRRYSHCFAITVPIWYRDAPVDDIRIPGIPTTAWKDLAACVAKQEEVLSNPEEGALSWRCNNELDPTVGGGRMFGAEMIDNADWIPWSGKTPQQIEAIKSSPLRTPKGDAIWPARAMFDDKRKPVLREDGKQSVRAFDPNTLYIVAAFDQSFGGADEWAGAVLGMDQYGDRYELEVVAGRNLEPMLDAAEQIRLKWNPRRIGMEKIAAQHAIELVLKLGEKYRMLKPRIEPVPHNNVAKDYRIRNYVAEVIRMGRSHSNPYDPDTKDEKKRYKPGPSAKDNRLDALAMCEVLIQKSNQPKEGEEDYRKKFARINAMNRSRRDTQTGVSLW